MNEVNKLQTILDALVHSHADAGHYPEARKRHADALRYARELLSSTPAASGVDLEQFRIAVQAYQYRQQEFGSVAGIAEGRRLLTLIDASPKGGSADANTAVTYECRQHYFSNGARNFTWTDWYSITKEQYENRLNNPKPDCEIRIRETAMRATSAEVGA